MLQIQIEYNDGLVEKIISLGICVDHFIRNYISNSDEMTPEDTAGIYADFDRVYKTMQADGFTGKLYK